jgi:lysyl-tRNA synthetase class 2
MQVLSEAIRDISYDDERAKLFVTFDDGDMYVYVGVPGEVHRSFLDADSKGQFFAYEIRDQYPYNKVGA